MTRALRSAVAALLILSPAPLVAQAPMDTGYPLGGCEQPKVPIGYLNGEGTLQYLMGPDGRADTTSLSIVEVHRISSAGFRSVAARLLSACRMDLTSAHPAGRFLVHQPLRIDSATVLLAPAKAAHDSLPRITDARPFVMPAVPLETTDTRLEERPRTLGCEPPRLTTRPPGGPFRSRAEADSTLAAWTASHRGSLRARVVVLPDGRVAPGQIQVLESSNPEIQGPLVKSISSCRFAPGRSGGVPVAAFTTAGTSMQLEPR